MFSADELEVGMLLQSDYSSEKEWDKIEPSDIRVTLDGIAQRKTSVVTGLLATPEILELLQGSLQCKKCGRCCYEYVNKNEKGIGVTEEEIVKMAAFTKKEPRSIIRLCKRDSCGKLILDKPCMFYKRKSCIVYPVRPLPCQQYPFFFKVVRGYSNLLDDMPLIHIDGSCEAGIEMGYGCILMQAILIRKFRYNIEPTDEWLSKVREPLAKNYGEALRLMTRICRGQKRFTILRNI